MVNEENDCHSHIFEPLLSNQFKTMYFQLLKKIFFDMLSLENIISDIKIRHIRPFFTKNENKTGKESWCPCIAS